MSEDKVHDLFPASCRLAIGSTDVKGTNTIEQWKATLDRYAKSSFGLYAKVIQTWKIDEEFLRITSHLKMKEQARTKISSLRRSLLARSSPA